MNFTSRFVFVCCCWFFFLWIIFHSFSFYLLFHFLFETFFFQNRCFILIVSYNWTSSNIWAWFAFSQCKIKERNNQWNRIDLKQLCHLFHGAALNLNSILIEAMWIRIKHQPKKIHKFLFCFAIIFIMSYSLLRQKPTLK